MDGLLDKIKAMPVIDTHEHFMDGASLASLRPDFYDMLTPYVCDILLCAGMPREQWFKLNDKSRGQDERWGLFEPYLGLIRHTTYFRAVLRAMRDIYGMEDVTQGEVIKAGEKLAESNHAGAYDELKKKNRIESVLTFIPFDAADDFASGELFPVPTVSDITPRSCGGIESLEKASGICISRFEELIRAVEVLFGKYEKAGVRAVKFGTAYRRKLDFEYASYDEAERVFETIIGEPPNGDSKMCGAPAQALGEKDLKPLGDFLTDFMVSAAGRLGIPVFFHTGLHAWNENSIGAARASHLEKLIRRHKNVNFILLHCGMPFIDEAVLLCRYYPNVYLNMTWSHIIDRDQSCLMMKKFIELLPVNKIHAFGGDYIWPQQVYGHLQFALENIASVLGGCVSGGIMTEPQALDTARRWLYENPKELLKI